MPDQNVRYQNDDDIDRSYRSRMILGDLASPALLQWIVKISGGRIIKNTRQASYVLLGAVGVILLAAIIVFLGASGLSSSIRPLHAPLGTGQ